MYIQYIKPIINFDLFWYLKLWQLVKKEILMLSLILDKR